MTSRRNTIQKDLVRNAVYEMKRHVTANEVYEFIMVFTVDLNDDRLLDACRTKTHQGDAMNLYRYAMFIEIGRASCRERV